MSSHLLKFERAYVAAMLWASTDERGEPLDYLYDYFDLSPEALNKVHADCVSFITQAEKIGLPLLIFPELAEQAGHDFWLTRNGHGTGFWDRPEFYEQSDAKLLTELSESKIFGAQDPYISDTGKIEID